MTNNKSNYFVYYRPAVNENIFEQNVLLNLFCTLPKVNNYRLEANRPIQGIYY